MKFATIFKIFNKIPLDDSNSALLLEASALYGKGKWACFTGKYSAVFVHYPTLESTTATLPSERFYTHALCA